MGQHTREHPAISNDRSWFRRKPDRRHRLRRFRPGELTIQDAAKVLSVKGDQDATMVGKLMMQADTAALEAEFLDGTPENHVPCILVSRHGGGPDARMRRTLHLPRELFNRRHQLSQGALDLIAAQCCPPAPPTG